MEQFQSYGVDPGVLTNYTQDLYFWMERLSNNPFSIKRLDPATDVLPFDVEPSIIFQLTGTVLEDLLTSGRLFMVDHSYQARYPTTARRFTAACRVYFFIHPDSQDFLPMAIKTNVGCNLIYTPLDDRNDWLIVKMMFNMNDFFHAQILHLANSHAVADIVHQAALRTIGSLHPVRAFLGQRTSSILS